jgi:hypothetical protein
MTADFSPNVCVTLVEGVGVTFTFSFLASYCKGNI